MNRKDVLLILLTVCTLPRVIAQTNWYVSTIGTNTNSGISQATAFSTVNYAISKAVCGDTIFIIPGSYNEKINAYKTCATKKIVIEGKGTNRPLIIGDLLTPTKYYAISASGQGFVFNHLEFTSPQPDTCNAANQVIVGSGSDMYFIDVVIRNAGYDGIKTYATCSTFTWAKNWHILNSHIYKCGMGCAKITLAQDEGDGVDFTECHNCEIKNTIIEDNNGYQVQVKLEARNVKIDSCTIKGNHIFQIGLPGGTAQCFTTTLNADSVYIRHNIIIASDSNEFVFKLADVSHLEISNNTVVKDNMLKNNAGFICFGGCFGNGTGWLKYPKAPIVIRNNIFANMGIPFLFGTDSVLLNPFNKIKNQVSINYNVFYDINGSFSLPPDSGSASQITNPLWCNYSQKNFHLQTSSPCINNGDPLSQNDPDATKNDIGALYYQGPCSIGIEEYKNTNDFPYKIYPNPNSGEFTISLNNFEENIFVEIYNILGQVVIRKPLDVKDSKINLTENPTGIYFIKIIINGSSLFAGKVIKN